MQGRTSPLVAIVVAGGQVQEVLLENWQQPAFTANAQFLTLDYDSHKYPDGERVPIPYGPNKFVIACKRLIPTLIGPDSHDVLTPSRVLAAKEAIEHANGSAVRCHLPALRKHVEGYFDAVDAAERAPNGDDYNRLYMLVIHGLDQLQANLPATSAPGNPPAAID